MKQEHWGSHLTVDFSGCNKEKISDIEHIKSFSKELIKIMRASPCSDALIVYSGSNDNAGYTLFQSTQYEKFNILAQFCDQSGDMYLDVVGCGIVVPQDIISVAEKYFMPSNYMRNFNIRDANPIPKGWLDEYTKN